MFDYIDVLIHALYEHESEYMPGEYYLQTKREKRVSDKFYASLSPEQIALYQRYEEARNETAELFTAAMVRQAFLLAKEIYL